MTNQIDFSYRFHPAGQGIFASGRIDRPKERPFHWVFDCGSTAPVTVLKPAVARYRQELGVELDLLCISHFDKDHVSGLGDLLNGLDVDTVVMPYWSPIERLVLIATDDNSDPDYIRFLGNPVAFVINQARSVRRIVIMAGPDGDPSPGEVTDTPPLEPRGDRPINRDKPFADQWESKLDLGEKVRHWWDNSGMAKYASDHDVELVTMAISTRWEIRMGSRCGWEFLFHHKPIDPAIASAIRADLDLLAAQVGKPFTGDIVSILGDVEQRAAIREIYDSSLPSGESINSTSLCVYGGPLLDLLDDTRLVGGFSHIHLPTRIERSVIERSSILYTGDADFSKSQNRIEVMNRLTPHRWDRIGILQVPHHGSRYNWEAGSVQAYRHVFSVFCAAGGKHPHPEVMTELLNRCPVLVNRTNVWSWFGIAFFRGSGVP